MTSNGDKNSTVVTSSVQDGGHSQTTKPPHTSQQTQQLQNTPSLSTFAPPQPKKAPTNVQLKALVKPKIDFSSLTHSKCTQVAGINEVCVNAREKHIMNLIEKEQAKEEEKKELDKNIKLPKLNSSTEEPDQTVIESNEIELKQKQNENLEIARKRRLDLENTLDLLIVAFDGVIGSFIPVVGRKIGKEEILIRPGCKEALEELIMNYRVVILLSSPSKRKRKGALKVL